MNRRRFIKRAISVIGGAGIFRHWPLQAPKKEIPVTLGNRSILLFDPWGISSSDVRQRIDEIQAEEKEVQRIARSLDDGRCVSARIDGFGRMCAAQRPELARLPMPQSFAVRCNMERILADNPEISREDAFFQAVMEIAEESI